MTTFIISAILFGWVGFVCWRRYQKRSAVSGCGPCHCGCKGRWYAGGAKEIAGR